MSPDRQAFAEDLVFQIGRDSFGPRGPQRRLATLHAQLLRIAVGRASLPDKECRGVGTDAQPGRAQQIDTRLRSTESDSDEGPIIPRGGAVTVLIGWIAFRHAAG